MAFVPDLEILPASQRSLWPELGDTPGTFTLYGGTALALWLGHRTSIDFDFFSNSSFDPDDLARSVPYLKDAERVQVGPDTLTCRVQRGGPILVSFFGGLGLGQVEARERAPDMPLYIASLPDLAGTKVAVVQKRAEVKDYIDIDALLRRIDLPTMLAAGMVVYGRMFNPLITLKALSYFDDLPMLGSEVRMRLARAVEGVDIAHLPLLQPYAKGPENGTER